MIFPLDTNAFSDLMRKHAKVEAPLTSLTAGDRVIMGPIVRDEIRYGTLSTTRVTRDKAQGNQATLTDDEYYEKEYRIIGHCHGKNFRLGDSVPARVARINAFHSAIDFELAQTSKVGSS